MMNYQILLILPRCCPCPAPVTLLGDVFFVFFASTTLLLTIKRIGNKQFHGLHENDNDIDADDDDENGSDDKNKQYRMAVIVGRHVYD